MSSVQTIPTTPPEFPSMDAGALRAEGVRLLERLASHAWTDFNAHDPGITILEQLCYAITELGYRITHEMPDLLAEDGDPYRSLPGPRAALTSEPVTLLDLRKLILDVPGVRNAWVEVAEAPGPALVHHAGTNELRLQDPSSPPAPSRVATPVALAGLFRVLVAASDLADIDAASLRRDVARRLHAHRPLCTDFAEIRVLAPEDIQVHARIEIGHGLDPKAMLVAVYDALARHIAPSVQFHTLSEMLAEGKSIEEIFSGPCLSHGFIDSEVLARMERRTALHTSDLLRDLMDVPGVRAVHEIALTSGRPGERAPEPWTLALGVDHTPRFDGAASVVTLSRDGAPVSVDSASALQAYLDRRKSAAASPLPAASEIDRVPPPGRRRDVRRYTSIQRQLPACYGVGEDGLAASAPAERRARQKQLKAYLLFFDQLLCNAFAQLGHAATLLSFHGEGTRTYESQPVPGERLGLDALRRRDAHAHAAWLRAAVDTPERSRPSPERAHRFLDHLLARFGEAPAAYSPIRAAGEPAEEALARDKRSLLQDLPRLAGARGTGCDVTAPRGDTNRSGLEQRIQRLLGLSAAHGETFFVIEHILLRPVREDLNQLGDGEIRPIPILAASPLRDPYSLKLSFVFPDWPARFADADFRALVERTVRAETPAHLTPYVHWLSSNAWDAVRAAYDEWTASHRSYWTSMLGV